MRLLVAFLYPSVLLAFAVPPFLRVTDPVIRALCDIDGVEESVPADGEFDEDPSAQANERRVHFDYPPALYVNSRPRKKFSLSAKRVGNGRSSYQVVPPANQTTVRIPSNKEFAPYERFTSMKMMINVGMLDIIEKEAYRTRLLNERYYANKDSFEIENLDKPPGLIDLTSENQDKDSWEAKFWSASPAPILTFSVACFVFPYIVQVLDRFVTMPPDQLGDITDNFGPGVSILYGTFSSLTVSILYSRIKAIQEAVATEASLLVQLLRNLLYTFAGHPDRIIEAGRAVADQIRTLVKSSRGAELMQIIYTDPYARLLELLDDFDNSISDELHTRKQVIMSSCRDLIKDLTKCRSVRLAEEARALPPTHFLILNVLTSLILLAYCVNVLPTLDRIGSPPAESIYIFGVITMVYILFFNFAEDLNNPFKGVYQIRRSTAASHLLEAKWLIVNHPILRGQVDFEEVPTNGDDNVLIRTPGLGDCVFEKDNFLFLMGTPKTKPCQNFVFNQTIARVVTEK